MRPMVSVSVSLSGSLTVLRWGCVCVVLMCVSVVGVNLSVVAFLVESRIGSLVLLYIVQEPLDMVASCGAGHWLGAR